MIRKLETKDIDKIMDIWLKSTIKAHNFISKEYWETNYDTVKNVYIPIANTFIYEDDNNIKGFISIINNEFIGALFVDIESQGLGVGTELIKYTKSIYEELTLSVYKENNKSVEFYKKVGFKIIEERPNEDTNHMEYSMKN